LNFRTVLNADSTVAHLTKNLRKELISLFLVFSAAKVIFDVVLIKEHEYTVDSGSSSSTAAPV
jgi:hypothetical protein